MVEQTNKKTTASEEGPKPAPPSSSSMNNTPCGICTKPLTDPKEARCGHIFCANCLFDKFKAPCPDCGAALFEKTDMEEVIKNRGNQKTKKGDKEPQKSYKLTRDDESECEDDSDAEEGHFADHKFHSSEIGWEARADYMDEFGGDAWDGL